MPLSGIRPQLTVFATPFYNAGREEINFYYFMKILTIQAGTLQSRLRPSEDPQTPSYYLYSQESLEHDLNRGAVPYTQAELKERRTIRTTSTVRTVASGDIVFSLTGRTAALVHAPNDGFGLTGNFVRVTPLSGIDPAYLVWLLNEDRRIRAQISRSAMTSTVTKINGRDLEALEVPGLPALEVQKNIGESYLVNRRLRHCRQEAAQLEYEQVLVQLQQASLKSTG